MCDHTCTRFLTSSILRDQNFVLYPHPAYAWMLISSAPISQKQTHAARVARPFPPRGGMLKRPYIPIPGGLHTRFVFGCLLNARRAAQIGYSAIHYTRTVQAPTGGNHTGAYSGSFLLAVRRRFAFLRGTRTTLCC